MKIKFDNTIDLDNSSQLEILPRLSFFWSDGAYCLGLGWLNFSMDVWFGNIKDLQ